MSCQKHDIIVLGGCPASPWLLLLYSLSQSAREIIFIFLLASFPSHFVVLSIHVNYLHLYSCIYHFYVFRIQCSMYSHVNEMQKEGEKTRKKGHSNNKAQKHNTPKTVTFPKKNELPHVGFEPMTLCLRWDSPKAVTFPKKNELPHVGFEPMTLCLRWDSNPRHSTL